MRQQGRDVIVLSLGEAHFDLPFYGCEDLPFPDVYHYSHSRGLIELRQHLAKYFSDEYGMRFDPTKEIIITAGSKIAIHMAFMSILDPGDEVVIFEPYWVSYPEQVRLCYGVPVTVPVECELAEAERFVSKKTKCIVINNPNNPRGRAYTAKELTGLLELARKHDIYVLSDEAYSDFVVQKNDFVSIGKLDPGFKNSIVCNSISKNYGISGWRLGYVIANAELISQILKVNQHLITCPATILEHYIAKHFWEIIKITKPQIMAVLTKRQEVANYMDRIGLSYLPGDSTFYFFVSIAGSALSSEDFGIRLLQENGVCVVPGIGYGASCDRFVRVSVGKESNERIFAGLDLVKALIKATASGS